MILEPAIMIEAFYEQVKETYPGVSHDEMKLICYAQFEMLRDIITNGNYEEVRLQYLFVARASYPKIIKSLESIYQNKANGKIGQDDFDRYNKAFTIFAKSDPKFYKRYKERIDKLIEV